MIPTSYSNRPPAETSGIDHGLSRVRAARLEYEQAVADHLDAMKRYSHLPLHEAEKQELLRRTRDREQIAFATYKQSLDGI